MRIEGSGPPHTARILEQISSLFALFTKRSTGTLPRCTERIRYPSECQGQILCESPQTLYGVLASLNSVSTKNVDR